MTTVVFNPKPPHAVQHVFYDLDMRGDSYLDGEEHYLHADEYVPYDQVSIRRNADDAFELWRAQPGAAPRRIEASKLPAPMQIEIPTSARVGVEFALRGIPPGSTMTINGRPDPETMDATGTLEVTPTVAGAYRFRFERHGYRPFDAAIEVSA